MFALVWSKLLNALKKPESALLAPVEIPKIENAPQMPSKETVSIDQSVDLPHWLENEDALRDEGVIFGLSGSDPEEKIKIIESLFQLQSTEISKSIELFTEKINELNLKIGESNEKIDQYKTHLKQLEESKPADHELPRSLFLTILSLCMVVGNYFFIDYLLAPSLGTEHFFISLGIYLAGLFGVFKAKSIITNAEHEIRWRVLLAELVLPLTASFLVLSQTWDREPFLKNMGYFLFMMALFVYGGKMFLQYFGELKPHWSSWRKNLLQEKNKKANVEEMEQKIERQTLILEELRLSRWKILPEFTKVEGEWEQIQSKKNALIALFMSEYMLAADYKGKMSKTQIRKIIEHGE